jgi:hypothetical protein
MAFDQVLAERIRDGLEGVDGERLDDDGLTRWLRSGVDFASALPPK